MTIFWIIGAIGVIGTIWILTTDTEPCDKENMGYNCKHRSNECNKSKG